MPSSGGGGEPPFARCFASIRQRGGRNDSARDRERGARRPLDKYIYRFGDNMADGDGRMKDLLGGKGAGLAEMSRIGLNVPAGFTISTEVCEMYAKAEAEKGDDGGDKAMAAVWEEVQQGIQFIEQSMGRNFAGFSTTTAAATKSCGGGKNGRGKRGSGRGTSDGAKKDDAIPLLVSVRSGAAASMPGMMDTVLNLGMNDEVVAEMVKALPPENARFAHDAYRRLLDMFGNVVLGIPHEAFDAKLEALKENRGVEHDTELTEEDLESLVEDYRRVYDEHGHRFPSDPTEQLRAATEAVFRSWNNERAVTYRRINKVTGLRGTAVNIQAMVYGNMGDTSCSGVCFTRNPSTGEKKLYGEYLLNSQGEDVVAGIRTPKDVLELRKPFPEAFSCLSEYCDQLEEHYKDMMDIEFTVERERLYILQCRSGKRTGQGALRIAVEMVNEGQVTEPQALCMVEPRHVDQLLHPCFDSKESYAKDVVASGLPASPGAAVGRVVFTAAEAEAHGSRGVPCILVRNETSAEDVGGMHAASGILTARGGMTSHAAVVARGWGKPCVVGCGTMKISESAGTVTFTAAAAAKKGDAGDSGDGDASGRATFKEGDVISLNGATGEVIGGAVKLVLPSADSGDLAEVMRWADKYRTLRVMANADTPDDATTARDNGAEGIGLVRTEHMFFGPPARVQAVRRLVLADSESSRKAALDELLPYQRDDFTDIFKAMSGLPVTVRLLDPPLHEFLPPPGEMDAAAEQIAAYTGMSKERVLERARALREVNPMLGLRGCRLGITFPEMTKMQARAIFEAAIAAQERADDRSIAVFPQIMIPLVGSVAEYQHQNAIVRQTAKEVLEEHECELDFEVGVMIEVPRATLIAKQLVAAGADFFSFGTNDLTQMMLGES